MTGTVKGYQIGKNRDGSQNVLLLQCAINSPDDVQLVEYMNAPGDNSIPPVDSIVTILEAGKSWKIAVACNDGKDFDDTLNEGEKYLYSDGEAATIRILNDGAIEINGNGKRFVTYAELNAALQSMVTALNVEMQAIAAGATAAISASGLWLTPLAGVIGNNSVDISASETQTVKTGG